MQARMRFSRRVPIWIALVAAAAGLLLVAAGLVLVNYSRPQMDISDGYLAIANAFLLLTLSVVLLAYADDRRLRIRRITRIEENVAGLLQHLDNIFQTRTKVSMHILKNQDSADQLTSCIEQSSEFLRFLIDEARAMLEAYTNNPCAVSIKLLVPSDDKVPSVKTYLRDKKSELVRTQLYPGEGLYSYLDHSPFVDIISGRTEGDYFLNNDLRVAAADGLYENGNKQWPKLYNATLIVPIKDPSTLSQENLIGFLCVDSLTAKFDERVCVYSVRIIANTIFNVISALSMLEARLSATSHPAQERKRAADV